MPFRKGQSGNPKGRAPKAEKHARPIARAEKRIADHLPDLIDRMFELANGVAVEDTNPVTGETTVYTRPPDRQSLEYLINRIMGKPTERQETDMDGALTINVIYASPDTDTP